MSPSWLIFRPSERHFAPDKVGYRRLQRGCKTPRSGDGIVSTKSRQDGAAEELLRQIFGLGRALLEATQLKDQLRVENTILKEEVAQAHGGTELVGTSEALRAVLEHVQLVGPTDATVLLLGETGTGKGLIARKVHEQSDRRDRSFVKVDCGAIPPTLIESELFGHEKGAFTGATWRKPGHFALANGGTLFLDEICELPRELQAKLLRVLHDGEVQRIGSTEIEKVDVRVIAATNRDLERAVDTGEFRSDLYYRLAVFPIVLPPLRKRREDIPLLTTYFVCRAATSFRKTITVIPDEVINALVAYDWPGNVRELRNVVERAMILSRGETLELGLPLDPRPNQHVPEGRAPEKDLAAMERRHIVNILEQCGGKIKGPGNAAEQLGLKPSTLRSRMKKLEILRPRALNEAIG